MTRLSGSQRLIEVGMIMSCVFSFFLLVALVTFDPSDPGWSQTGFEREIQNWMGSAGAYCADILIFGFGVSAYIIPFGLAFIGWYLFLHIRRSKELDYLTISLRVIGILLVVFGFTGLASINFDDVYNVSAGGAMGDIISSALIPHFSVVGTILLLLCFFCTGFTLTTGVSWLQIVDWLGEKAIWLSSLAVRLVKGLSNNTLSRSESREKNIDILQAQPELLPSKISNDTLTTSPSTQLQETAPGANVDAFSQGEGKNENIQEKSPKVSEKKIAKQNTAIDDKPKIVTGTMPSFELLQRADRRKNPVTSEELEQVSRLLESKLADFNIQATVVDVLPGPVITRFEMDLAPGVKVNKIVGLAKDLARAMSAISVRVVEVIPGKSVIGLELPNKNREMVRLSEVIGCNAFQSNKSPLTMVLGADISGQPVVVDLAKMPHLLVAGTTGSGKSVGVNVMILSLLYKSTPEDVRMIMIDPKMLELSVYEGIPHLLTEVVTDMKEAANALRWCVGEMERRYRLMSALGVRNLSGYNKKIIEAAEKGEELLDPLWNPNESMDEFAPSLEKFPSIVVVVDEFADMMMIVGKKVEELIARIAQKARAAGIHLILATQRPSVDVITGLIKANIPTRIAFQVSSKIDSRTIIDQQGAESLLGMGDMLYNPPGTSVTTRVHGAFVDDHEVHAVVADWKNRGEPDYIDEILSGEMSPETLLPGEQVEGAEQQEYDAFYDEAVQFVTETRKVSVSSVQRKFRIGYNRAARIVEQMEIDGVISAAGHNGNREVLAPPPVKG